ncbi:hypothetical protein [Bacillus sp. FJAT-42376]|nr:hypothetical protein [Bacillus sp. FJAT-42376]
MKQEKQFPVAELTAEELGQLQKFEEDFRNRTGEEIVLIAYEHQD